MTLTLVAVEKKLAARCGKKMSLVGFDTSMDGSNPDLIDPMITALMDLGSQPDSSDVMTDADLLKVDANQINEFLDRAELRLLENIAGNLDMVNISVGPRNESLGDLASQVEKAIDRLITKISQNYGPAYNASTQITGGTLSLDFQEKELP
jgi:hypothetical protein